MVEEIEEEIGPDVDFTSPEEPPKILILPDGLKETNAISLR